jgi:2,4-dienoyl-CoA reductase-like NADH-dependent reductase (Old Yellow Enzyme family)
VILPPNLSSLFTPVRVANRTLPSRVLLAPINTGFARNGRPTYRLLLFHSLRAGPEIGISTLGNVAVSAEVRTNSNTAVLQSAADVSRFAVIARRIQASGSLAGIQLAYSPPGLRPEYAWVVQDRTAERKRLTSIVDSYSDDAIQRTLGSYARSAILAAKARFDVVQIHAAHGYLLSLLLSPLVNRRTGYFSFNGPWLPGFALSILEVTRDCLTSFRLSLFSGLVETPFEELAAVREISRTLANAGIHILDYSAGFYTVDKRLIYPGIERGVAPLYNYVQTLSADVKAPLSFAGNITDLRMISGIPTQFLISVGRSFIADAEFAKKSLSNRFDTISRCDRTGHCHYFSRRKGMIECPVNEGLSRTTLHECRVA